MIINIYGSTGIIGKTALSIINKQFSNYKINLLCAKNNFKLLAKQSREYNVKYLYLDNQKLIYKLKSLVPKNVKILEKAALDDYLKKSKSDFSILSVAGFESLKYVELILMNTDMVYRFHWFDQLEFDFLFLNPLLRRLAGYPKILDQFLEHSMIQKLI